MDMGMKQQAPVFQDHILPRSPCQFLGPRPRQKNEHVGQRAPHCAVPLVIFHGLNKRRPWAYHALAMRDLQAESGNVAHALDHPPENARRHQPHRGIDGLQIPLEILDREGGEW